MQVTAWSNGKESPNGNGISISISDRDMYLKREWESISIELGDSGKVITANIDKVSLWNGNCRHLINKEIGRWLHENNLSPWKKGNPPKLNLVLRGGQRFILTK
jgi:hypothetical protein